MSRITNEQREAIVRKAVAERDALLAKGRKDESESLSQAASDVLAERQRQISVEGWTAEHDDEHGDGSMARAAAAYCLCGEGPPAPGVPSEFHSSRPWEFNILRAIWPRSWNWPNPKDRRSNLVRAAALIIAEIERLDRAAPPARNVQAEDRQPDKKDSAPVAQVVEPLTECHGLDTPERVFFYEQDFYVLSNFSAFSIYWSGLRFDTSEHLYHWLKFNRHGDDQHDIRESIRLAPSAHETFKIAERNKQHRRPDWDAVKVDTMRDILRAKAGQHEYVRRKLLATGDRELVENSWRDDFWGWGASRNGLNMLGKLWMQIRAELRGESA